MSHLTPDQGADDSQPEGMSLPGFDAPPATVQAPEKFSSQKPVSEKPAPYRVLARKYRPQSFEDLIGQDAMVQTLSNAFAAGRIPQAWILTGVRGVGKTTTARILARGLNYQPLEGEGGPTVTMPSEGVHCRAIIESRHIDVLEMDAASHTSVDDVRAINEGVRYAPVSARYKVYIIDEVHMLSKSAFNAFLKTLEEPPPHAKFIFATTDIRSVPVTILSRCQRFDLRRVESSVMIAHLAKICGLEGVEIEPEALSLVARAAEGSVRDALSLLDQAIAHGAGKVDGEIVRSMLGLADRARVIDLFEAVMKGDIATALHELRNQYNSGADPASVVADLAEFTHFVTRLKVVPEAAYDGAVTEIERVRGQAQTILSMRVLSRAWQMLLKGHREVQDAARPIAAAEMLLVRLAYAADLPTPDEALKMLDQQGGTPGGHAPSAPRGGSSGGGGGGAAGLAVATRSMPVAAVQPASQPAMRLERFEDLVALADEKRDLVLKRTLETDIRLVRFEDGLIEFAPVAGASVNLAADLGKKLQEWTGRRWLVAVSSQQGQETLREVSDRETAQVLADVSANRVVRAVLDAFPGARVVDVRDPVAEALAAQGDDDLPLDDSFDFTMLDDDND